MTTLDELKMVIGSYERHRTDADRHWYRAEAWRTAFQWRDGRHGCGPQQDEYLEGMALIREKLI